MWATGEDVGHEGGDGGDGGDGGAAGGEGGLWLEPRLWETAERWAYTHVLSTAGTLYHKYKCHLKNNFTVSPLAHSMVSWLNYLKYLQVFRERVSWD